MEIKAYLLNAFTKKGKGGNPAGVVPGADTLNEKQMKYIAKKVGFSETPFIRNSDHADFQIRYFTPTAEVDLCGHATIASFQVLLDGNFISHGNYTIETSAGILEVRVENVCIYLSQALPIYDQVNGIEEILESLNISVNDLNPSLPIQIVSTGLRDILIPIRNREILNTIEPTLNEIEKISKYYNVIGYHLFSLDPEDSMTAHCRNFAPLYEIPEESATGTSNGALTCYLHKYGIFNNNIKQFVFEQGYSMKATSEIRSRLALNEIGEISRIEVGGVAGGLRMERIII